MAKVPKKRKKKSNNTNPIEKLSDIAPELAVYDIIKKHLSYALLFRKAKCIARYSAEENFSTSRKSTIKRLFSEEHFFAVRSSRTYLLTVENLSQEDRNNLCREFKKCFDKIKDLLFESLDNKVPNLDKFNELEKEEITLMQELDFDAGTFLTQGIVDDATRAVTYPKPAKIRPPANSRNAGKNEQKRPPVQDFVDAILGNDPSLANHEKDVLLKVNQKLKQGGFGETKSVKTQIYRWRRKNS